MPKIFYVVLKKVLLGFLTEKILTKVLLLALTELAEKSSNRLAIETVALVKAELDTEIVKN